jgi:hypothetical protein
MVKANFAPSGKPCRITPSGKRIRDRPAENDDDRVLRDKDVQIAAEQHHRRNNDHASHEPYARHDIHGRLQRVRETRLSWTGATQPEDRAAKPYVGPIKDPLPEK